MFNKLLKIGLSFAILFSVFQPAQAEFVKQGLFTANDNRVVLDTDTGIEWMSPYVNKGKSINTVIDQIAPGGELAGWRFPTLSEVEHMISQFNYNYTFGIQQRGLQYRKGAQDFISLFGITGSNAYESYAIMRFAVDGGGIIHVKVGQEVGPHFEPDRNMFYVQHFHVSNGATYSYDYASSKNSVWLVSDGGVSFASKSDPTLNINNPNSPINQGGDQGGGGISPADVPNPFLPASLGLILLCALRNARSKQTQ